MQRSIYNPEIPKHLIQIKLLIENKHVICALGNFASSCSNLPLETDANGMRTRIAQVAERRARNPEVRGSNPVSGSNVSFEIL